MVNRYLVRWWVGFGGLVTCWWVWCDFWNRLDEFYVKVFIVQRQVQLGSSFVFSFYFEFYRSFIVIFNIVRFQKGEREIGSFLEREGEKNKVKYSVLKIWFSFRNYTFFFGIGV